MIIDVRRAARAVQPIEEALDVPDAALSPEAAALAREEQREITTLLGQLEPGQRELLELRLAGLTDAEIARVLGRSHGAVRTAQYRSIAKLQAILGASGGEEVSRADG